MNLQDRFLTKVDKNPNGCWLWTGAKVAGYGHMRVKDKDWKAHRVAWTLYKGEIPKDLCVCHSCDTPLCVNPDHLFLGSQSDNMRDMHTKRRHQMRDKSWVKNMNTKGEANPKAKLTAEQVQNIRTSELSSRELAAAYGVTYTTIWAIRTYRIWK